MKDGGRLYYWVEQSPIGDLLLLSNGAALTGLRMEPHGGPDPDWVKDAAPFRGVREQLRAYFAGDLSSFDVALDARGTPFQIRVWEELRRIPYGETISYAELARRIGNPKAVRAVGGANGRNPIGIIVPCHRVIAADGGLGGYGGGLERKRALLELERRGARQNGGQRGSGVGARALAAAARSVAAALLVAAGAAFGGSASAQPSSTNAAAGPGAGDRVIMITGSTDGLGRKVALDLARPGTHIIVHGRNRERGEEVVRAVVEKGGTARFYAADFASLEQVRELARAILRDYGRLHVLVNNAGIWLDSPEGRQLSQDGHEMHFAVNYLSGFLLTRMLLPLLEASAPARIINVASGAQTPIDFDDVMLARNYSDGRGYGQSKLAQILFTFDLARELEGKGVTVNALHPATMMNTSMVLERGGRVMSNVEEGAAAVVNLIESADIGTGQYFNGMRPARANAQAYDEEARARLRALSRELTGAP